MLSKGSWLVTNQLGGRKILNNYFNLGWIAIIKLALSDAQHGQLAESHLKTNYANGIPYIFSHICTPAVSLQLVICINILCTIFLFTIYILVLYTSCVISVLLSLIV